MKRAAALASMLLAVAAQAAVLDDLRSAAPWRASASDQVQAALRRDADGSLCLDYDFAGVSGYAVMRRELPVQWPAAFDLVLRYKQRGGANDVQLKFADASGDNVWWVRRPDHGGPATLTDWVLRRRHVEFAWGPASDHALRATRSVELAVAAGRDGGRGSLCIARLELRPRAPDPDPWPAPSASVHDGQLELDLHGRREFNGLVLHWPEGAHRLDYDVLASDEPRGPHWRVIRRVRGSDGALDALFLPESQARRLRVRPQRRVPLPQLALRSPADWPDFNALLAELARAAPRGDWPRAFLGEQNYWTLVGIDGGGERSALLSEDGAIELGRGGPSIEPMLLLDDGTSVTWADAALTQSLRDGGLPLPAVHWRHAAVALDIEAAADGPRDQPQALARYTVTNLGPRARRITLMLALRPWQVNPPQQFLTTPGGQRPIARLVWQDGLLSLDGRGLLRSTEPPARVTALAFDGGTSWRALRTAAPLLALADPQAHASALLQYELTLQPGERRRIGWAAALAPGAAPQPLDAQALDARFEQATSAWRQRLGRFELMLPPEAPPLAAVLRSTLAQILMSRDGPLLKPGTRSYARAWVRDGAMMVAALVRLGELPAAREFVDAYAAQVFASGKVPCCVDARGADPVAENDSHGEYLFAVAEVWRHTHDAAFLARHWPTVQRVVAYQESLRQSERGARNRTPERASFFGLLPPSISHEGYSDKPAYAYWDDLWALRGYKDAVTIAQALGHEAEAAQWAGWRDEFARELVASITATAARFGLDHVAGAADRGDLDPTSTTIALDPVQAALPPALLAQTFERYWQDALARSESRRAWRDYTPYEWRTVGALLRLGQPERAQAMLDFFLRDRRPPAWNQWPEVVRPGLRDAGFLGDLPHAWVASDFIRSTLDLLAYERESDAAVIVFAGLKPEWLSHEIVLRGLSTSRGVLDLALRPAGRGWRLTLGTAVPGLRLRWPGRGALPQATLAGRALAWQGRELPLPAQAAVVELNPD